MVKVCKRGLVFGCLALVNQGFGMELAKSGLADLKKYPLGNKSENKEKASVGFFDYVPTFGLWQNQSNDNNAGQNCEPKDPNSWTTKIMDNVVRGIGPNVLRELETGKFSFVPENISRVEAAVLDFIGNQQTEELVNLINRLTKVNFEFTNASIDAASKYLKIQCRKTKDEYATVLKIMLAAHTKETKGQCERLQNIIHPEISALSSALECKLKDLGDKGSSTAEVLTVYQDCLAKLKPTKYEKEDYTLEDINNEVGLSKQLNDYKTIQKLMLYNLSKIIILLYKLNDIEQTKI